MKLVQNLKDLKTFPSTNVSLQYLFLPCLGMMFTSCYKLNSGATTSTVVTAFGTYTVGTTNSAYTFTSDSSCNLDEANGKYSVNFQRK